MVVALLFYYLKSHQLSQVINDYFLAKTAYMCILDFSTSFNIYVEAASKMLVFSTAIVIIARKIPAL